MGKRRDWSKIGEVVEKIRELGLTYREGAARFGVKVSDLYEFNHRVNHAVDGSRKFVLGTKHPFSCEWEAVARSPVVFVAEGIIYYLSVKSLEPNPPPGLALLGNQLGFAPELLAGTQTLVSALDNDRGGDSALVELKVLYPEKELRIYDLEGHKDPNALLLAMVLPAAERAAQVQPTRAARIREKAEPTVAAGNDTATPVGMGLQKGVQGGLILAHQRVSAIVPVPVRAKGENFLERYDKKAKLSPIMGNVCFTPSCYFLAAKAPRGRTRFCLRCAVETRQPLLTTAALPRRSPTRTPCQLRSSSPSPTPGNDYLERRTSPSLLPSR